MNIIDDIDLTVSEFKGKRRIDIRKYFDNTMGERLPTQRGINLTVKQWEAFIAKLPELKAYIKQELEK